MITIDLTGKTAIVTGAGQGLGQAIAGRLHFSGANVVINYFEEPTGENRAKAQQIAQDLGDRCVALAADVRHPDQISRMIDHCLDRFGGLDILVNNAGILRDRTVKKMAISEWQDVIDTNLTGVFNCCQAAAERMQHDGRIVNLASVAAVIGIFGQANYSAAKAGVIALTKVLSKELARNRILVNAVAPGVVLTEMGKSIPEANRQAMLAQIPLGRFGAPDEIANVVLFLASDLASYLTGQTIHVNGGWWS